MNEKQRLTLIEASRLFGKVVPLDKLRANALYGKMESPFVGGRREQAQSGDGKLRHIDAVSAYPQSLLSREGSEP